jgi:hypothetical protein
MTKHQLRLLDLYTDYLLSSFGATTATGLSHLVPEVSHDQITRMLSQQPLSDRDLWKLIKPQVRAIESQEGVLIIDDSVEEKPYTDESELISWHYDHSKGRVVKGINLLLALYLSRDVSLRSLHRGLLQPQAKTLSFGLSQPARLRADLA